ncbi:MAG TPA: helicase-related protein [Vicinamibacterales bacterium]|nr:helicase-related protein [Vicinamibacterales bacterium]
MHSPLPVPGDVVWIRRRRWRVERAQRDRHVLRLDVAGRGRRLTFLSPFDRVVSSARGRMRRVRPQSALARLAHAVSGADDARIPSAAVAAEIELLPHQLEPAMAMLAGSVRMLIADEVGLGKTIQAGLAIAEIVRREGSPRILVLAPSALRDQWADELSRRFRLSCENLDRHRLDALTQAGAFGDNPWRQPGIWITSVDFLKQPHVRDGLPPDPWDLVVIDEAHGVCGESDRYDLCHDIGRAARRLILLTATPHNGDETRFDKLTQLGSLPPPAETPAGPSRAEGILIFRRTREAIGIHPRRRVRWHLVPPSAATARVFDTLQAFESAVTARSRTSDQGLLLLSVFRKRALSSMVALARSVERRLAFLGNGTGGGLEWMQPRLLFEPDIEEIDRDEREGLTVLSGLGPAQERSWLRRLRALADEASRDDSKIDRLASLLHRTLEPVVVFTEFRDSLDAIEQRLRFSRPVSVLHGGQDQVARRQQLRQFLDGATTILLATDVAGQGLNLQARARWVISLELPWNPARLEQRIGRVDRISQNRSTHLTLLIARHPMEAGLLMHLSRRVLAARRAMAADVLGVAIPSEAAVRTAMFQPEISIEPAGPGSVTMCRRWQRGAALAARAMRVRRALAHRWQAPDAMTAAVSSEGGAAARLVSGLPRRSPEGEGVWLVVCAIPFFDTRDRLIERRIVPVTVRADIKAPECQVRHAVMQAARSEASRAIRRRLRRLEHRTRLIGAAVATREAALVADSRDELALEQVQPGLFDLRGARAFDAQRREQDRLEAGATRRIDQSTRSVAVRAGEPSIEMILKRR